MFRMEPIMNKCEKHNIELESIFGSEPLCEKCFFEDNRNIRKGFMDKIVEIGVTTDGQIYIKIEFQGAVHTKELYAYLEESKDILGGWKNKVFVNILQHLIKNGAAYASQKT